jgi:hypothetical protein
MDPDDTLTELRALIGLYHANLPEIDPLTTLEQVADYFTALDEWLSSGGFLPSEWNADR